jgi:hypothetical protein
MQIIRTETPTGGPNRTERTEINTLNTGPREVEPEIDFLDFSESESWPWESDPGVCTWDVQLEAVRQFIVPFEGLDSQAAAEQSGGDDEKGGVYVFPGSNIHLPIGEGDDDGDLNSSNFAEKMGAFLKKYGKDGKPIGGTVIMASIKASDAHFLGSASKPGEFWDRPFAKRPIRARVVFTDGILQDAGAFRSYLSQATLDDGYGKHSDGGTPLWDEIWAIAILGEGQTSDGANPGKAAYEQYKAIAKDHPWVHAYYFEKVVNPAEIAEDMAYAVLPTRAG